MVKLSKRYKTAESIIDRKKEYTIEEAVDVLKELPPVKFDETVEVSCKLNVDPKKSDQVVRGSVVLPHGRGKVVKVLVFCEAEKEEEARQQGADFVGGQDLVDKILKEGWLDFDCCISTPSMMRLVSKLGRILGPRGLMPSPKTGTVTTNISYAIKEAKRGKVDFRMDKTGCLHLGVGKISFPPEAILENIRTFKEALNAAKPQACKGELVKSVHLSSSMGVGIKVRW